MTKEERYESLLPKLNALLSGEEDPIARMANVAALLHQEMGFWWTGFYRVRDNELVLGPFQGPVACTRIARGKGVCGTAWSERRTIVVADVEQFPGHIACSAQSRSEIVVPIWHQGTIIAVLDIDSAEKGTFDATDRKYLEKSAALLFGPQPAAASERDTAPQQNLAPQRDTSPQRDIWFAAGCFWGAQKYFKQIGGVEFTEVGFCNGQTKDPTYEQVYTDKTGHAECVHVRYNSDQVSLNELTRLFFRIIDPLSLNKQGEDVGTRYRTGIYYDDERDADILGKEFEEEEKKLGVRQMAVELCRLTSFYRADEYHQDYLDKHPGGYCHIPANLFLK